MSISDKEIEAYARGCEDGRVKAELYLEEAYRRPGMLGSSVLGKHVDKIRPFPKNALQKGRLVGFFSRVERELASTMIERAWRTATSERKWKFYREHQAGSAISAKAAEELLRRMEDDQYEPTPEDFEAVIGGLNAESLARVEGMVLAYSKSPTDETDAS